MSSKSCHVCRLPLPERHGFVTRSGVVEVHSGDCFRKAIQSQDVCTLAEEAEIRAGKTGKVGGVS